MIHNSLLQTLSTNFSSFSVWFKVAVQNLRKQAAFLTCAAQKCLICLMCSSSMAYSASCFRFSGCDYRHTLTLFRKESNTLPADKV